MPQIVSNFLGPFHTDWPFSPDGSGILSLPSLGKER
jgi:hypothetical protein